MSARFDAYTATSRAMRPGQLIAMVDGWLEEEGAKEWHRKEQDKAFHQFGARVAYRDGEGEIASISYGGSHGDLCMVEVKGERTPSLVATIRGQLPEHRVSRVDSCVDFDHPGAFEKLLAPCLAVKAKHRLKGSKLGDWEDFPEDGRTLYLGSTASAVRLRLYEKGKQAEYRHLECPNWARAEAQVRPAKEAKSTYATLGPLEVWGASRWTRDLAAEILLDHVDPHPAGTVFKLDDRERALRWMCRQYGPAMVSLRADCGDWATVGLTLGEMVRDEQQKQRREAEARRKEWMQ